MAIEIIVTIAVIVAMYCYYKLKCKEPQNEEDNRVNEILIDEAKKIVNQKFPKYLNFAQLTNTSVICDGSGYIVNLTFSLSGIGEAKQSQFAKFRILDTEHHYERKLLDHNIEYFDDV